MHTHSQIDLWFGSLWIKTNTIHLTLLKTEAVPFHFIHRDQPLGSYRVWGVDVSYLWALFIWISLMHRGRVYVKCWICYANSLRSDDKMDLKRYAHRYLLFVYLLCHVLCLPNLVIIPVLHHDLMIISIPKKQVLMEGQQQQSVIDRESKSIQLCVHTVRHSTLCVLFILETHYLVITGILFTPWT